MTGLFDSTPNVVASGAVAGTSTNPSESNALMFVLYIQDMFDPDIHPLSERERYVVPRENQLVVDVPNKAWYRVKRVDYEGTLKADLEPWFAINSAEEATVEQDWIFGIKGGPMVGEALLAVDFSVRPNVARVDATIMRPGAAYALLYKGGTAKEGTVISAVYDQGLVKQTDQIPTPLAEIVDRTNLEIKTTGPFSVTENEESLPNGTQCFLAFYDIDGDFIPPGQLVRVQHSAYMKDHRIGTKYIDSIRLLTPWFSNSNNPNKVMVPINVNLLSLELRAEVLYSDGSSSGPMAVNGTKFSLEGLQEHRPSYPGQTSPVVLIYKLASNEKFYLARPGNPEFERVTYTFEAAAREGAYSPRLFTYPQWDTSINGYRLQHFLYDLDRKTFVDVSTKVTINSQSPAWRPAAYGVAQSMIFNINLRDVSIDNESVTFIQYTELTLLRNFSTAGRKFEVSFVFDKPTYQGAELKIKTNDGANTKVNLANAMTTQTNWLNLLYWGVYPSHDSFNEDQAPLPTHFYLMHEDGRKWMYPLADWNKDLALGISVQTGKTWYVVWVKRDAAGNELQLAATGVSVTA